MQLCLAVLATVLPSTAAAWPSGYISPPAAAPEFNPAAWNQAYKLTLKGVPAASAHNGTKALLQAIRFPNTMLQNVQLPQDCSDTGFDSTAAETVPLVSRCVEGCEGVWGLEQRPHTIFPWCGDGVLE